MTEQNHLSRVWDIIERARIGMLTTQFSGGLRARPLEMRADSDVGLIWFLTDVRGAKDDEINAAHDVGLVLVDVDSGVYLSVTGRATATRDSAKAKEIWKGTDDIWFPGGPDDPNLRVLQFEPNSAELWEGQSSAVGTTVEFSKTRLIGEKHTLSENRKVTVATG